MRMLLKNSSGGDWWRRTVLAGAMVALCCAGCGRQQPAVVETSAGELTPEMQSTLGDLNHELRRTMLRHHFGCNFAEFAALRPDLQIPPPPVGKKYAINPQWKVVLVNDQSSTK